MIRMFARRTFQRNIGAGSDAILFGVTLPSGSRIHDININVKYHGTADAQRNEANMIAAELWLLPLTDPDAAIAYNTLWDNLVPKDSDAETLDLDTGATDTTPFFEPGEVDMAELFDVGTQPERLWTGNRLLTLSSGSVYTFQDNQTPFAVKWVPGGQFRIRIKRRLGMSKPMALVLGIASPSLDDTQAGDPTSLIEAQIPQLKYIEHVLERALLHVLGVFEAGAETPFEEATALLREHLEPDVFEATGASFVTQNWFCYGQAMIDHSVVGTMEKITLSTGR